MEALLDKRAPQRKEATGDTLSDAPALGTARGSARQLTQNELDALRARLAQLWNPPAGAQNPAGDRGRDPHAAEARWDAWRRRRGS